MCEVWFGDIYMEIGDGKEVWNVEYLGGGWGYIIWSVNKIN